MAAVWRASRLHIPGPASNPEDVHAVFPNPRRAPPPPRNPPNLRCWCRARTVSARTPARARIGTMGNDAARAHYLAQLRAIGARDDALATWEAARAREAAARAEHIAKLQALRARYAGEEEDDVSE